MTLFIKLEKKIYKSKKFIQEGAVLRLKNTVLTKVFLLLFVVVVPLVVISSVSIGNINKQLQQELLTSIDADSLNFSKQINDGAKEIYISNMPLSMQSNIQMLVVADSSLSEYEKAKTLNTISEQLSNICTTNNYLESAHIYYRDARRVYHTKNSFKGSFDDFTMEQYEFLSQKAIHPETLHRYVNPLTGNEVLSIFIMPFGQSEPRFIIEMVLSEEYIKSVVEAKDLIAEDLYYIEMCGKVVATDIDQINLTTINNVDFTARQNLSSKIDINDTAYYIMKYHLPYCDGYYLKLISTAGLMKPLKMSSIYLMIFFIVLVISCVFFFIGIYRLVHKPLTKLTRGFELVESGNFNTMIQETGTSDFSYLYHAFNDMTVNLENLIERDYNQKIFLQKAELKQLQAQINPHFLYNSFFLLQTMLKTGQIEKSQQMAEQLGLYFRYITKNNAEYVTLENEYNHAKLYSNIQALRFNKRIEINIEEIPNEYKNILSPKLILQPIIENSFNYGLSNKVSGGLLSMCFEKADNDFRIIIEDNGDELSDEKLLKLQEYLRNAAINLDTQEMSGMLNIHRRLVIYSNSKGYIEVSRSHMGGLRVDLILNTEGNS